MTKRSVLFFLMLVSAVSLSAAGIIDDPVFPEIALVKSGKHIKVFYSSDESRFVKVTVTDTSGNTVFYDVVKAKRGFIFSYNISSLASGNYVVRVSDSSGSRAQSFEVSAPGVVSP